MRGKVQYKWEVIQEIKGAYFHWVQFRQDVTQMELSSSFQSATVRTAYLRLDQSSPGTQPVAPKGHVLVSILHI